LIKFVIKINCFSHFYKTQSWIIDIIRIKSRSYLGKPADVASFTTWISAIMEGTASFLIMKNVGIKLSSCSMDPTKKLNPINFKKKLGTPKERLTK
jgi:hypothetical protein